MTSVPPNVPEIPVQNRLPWWAPVGLAWSFLTIMPAPTWTPGPRTLMASTAFFPVIGLALGGLLGGVGLLLDHLLSSGPVAVLLLAGEAVLTGGLHFDGLLDTADGVFGGRTIEHRLEIMKDSRVGAFGAVAGVLALLGAYTCLANLDGLTRLLVLVVTLPMSRWAMALALAIFPAARSVGLGATFRQSRIAWPALIATASVVLLAWFTRPFGVVALILAGLIMLAGGWYLTRRLGGLSGDCYGALAVVIEVAVLYVAVGMLRN